MLNSQESSQFHVMLFPYKRRHSSWFSESCTSYFSTRHKPQATKFIALLFQKIIGKRRYWQDYRRVGSWLALYCCSECKSIKVNEGFGDRSGGSSNIKAGAHLRPQG